MCYQYLVICNVKFKSCLVFRVIPLFHPQPTVLQNEAVQRPGLIFLSSISIMRNLLRVLCVSLRVAPRLARGCNFSLLRGGRQSDERSIVLVGGSAFQLCRCQGGYCREKYTVLAVTTIMIEEYSIVVNSHIFIIVWLVQYLFLIACYRAYFPHPGFPGFPTTRFSQPRTKKPADRIIVPATYN